MNHTLSVVLTCIAIKLLHGGDVLVQAWRPELRVLLAKIIASESCVARDPPGEKSTAQRAVRQSGNAACMTVGQDVGFCPTLKQVVRRLNRMQWRDGTKKLHLGNTEVADADRTDLPRTIQIQHCLCGLFDGRLWVRPVNLVNVDDVGPQTPQRILDFLADARATSIAKDIAVVPIQPNLGGNADLLSHSGFG